MDTMKDRLIRKIDSLKSYPLTDKDNESVARRRAISPILEILDWLNGDDMLEEYHVPKGNVDYALIKDKEPKVFIEAKRAFIDLSTDEVEMQILTYCIPASVRIAVLTTGMNWLFYLPFETQEGSFKDRMFAEVDLMKRESLEVADRLIKYLAKDNVYSNEAEREAKDSLNHLRIKEYLAEVWEKLKNDPDERLIHLLIEITEQTHHVRPSQDEVKTFLNEIDKPQEKPITIKENKVGENIKIGKDLRPWMVTVEEPSGNLQQFRALRQALVHYGVSPEGGWERDMIERALKSGRFIEVSRIHNVSTKEIRLRLVKAYHSESANGNIVR
ncbi:hypothetical protein ACFLTZ_02410 [Chloroflexota bacterium]